MLSVNMLFGFAISDFVQGGQLSRMLYRDYYKTARAALVSRGDLEPIRSLVHFAGRGQISHLDAHVDNRRYSSNGFSK